MANLEEYIYALDAFPKDVSPTFVGEPPSLSTDGCGLVLIDGPDALEYFGATTTTDTSLFQPLVRFILRTSDYSTGASWATSLRSALHRYHDDVILSCMVVGSVLYLGCGEDKVHEHQLTFKTIIKEN